MAKETKAPKKLDKVAELRSVVRQLQTDIKEAAERGARVDKWKSQYVKDVWSVLSMYASEHKKRLAAEARVTELTS